MLTGLVTTCAETAESLLKIQGRIEVTGGRGRRREQLLDDLMETKTHRKLKRLSTSSHAVENSVSTRQ